MAKVKVDRSPTWITHENKDFFKKDRFRDIFLFYVLFTPEKDASARGIPLEQYGWDSEDELYDIIINKIKEKSVKSLELQHYEKIGLDEFPPKADLYERLCFENNKTSKVVSLLAHIRNGLAHGRFNLMGPAKDPIFVIEDVNTLWYSNARIVLKASTLKEWIKIIKKDA